MGAMGYACDMRKDGGEAPCGLPATHAWGGREATIHFCCHHFDLLVMALYDLQEAVAGRRHSDLVRIYEEHMSEAANLLGIMCDPALDDEKPPS